ncbi:MAG TPA: tetratricopeptide repeat protein, partial [Candidatus Acidoferrum sp.]|nr:tetratricopeptide repeat protein [Candidatus Acidoferrum sp.]
MLATKNPARWLSAISVAAAIAMLAGCTASGPRALLDGDRALRDGKFPRAIEKLKLATELMPDEPRAWNHLGLAYHQAGQAQLAAQAYTQALKRDRSNLVAVAHFNLGCLLYEQGNAAAAVDELRSFTMVTNSALGWVKLGEAQMRLRQFDSAERSFANALRLQQKDVEPI